MSSLPKLTQPAALALVAGLLVAMGGVVSNDAAAQQTQPQAAANAELVIRLEVLERELRELRGELEAQRFRQREIEAAIGRLDARGIAAPEPSAPAMPGTRDDPAAGGTGNQGGTLSGRPPAASTAFDTPTGEPGRTPGATTAPGSTGEPSFELGMSLLQAGRYGEARAELDRFVARNPNEPQSPEAAFWSAETLLFEGEYQAAAAAFAANYRAFGADATRAPDSLLKVAMALNELGDGARACQALNELSRRHGDLGRSLQAAVGRERERADCR